MFLFSFSGFQGFKFIHFHSSKTESQSVTTRSLTLTLGPLV